MFRYNGLILLAAASLGSLSGCEEQQKPSPPAPVRGPSPERQTDGRREIILSLTGETPSVLAVKDGSFAGTALTGTNCVEIRAFKPGKPLSTDPRRNPRR